MHVVLGLGISYVVAYVSFDVGAHGTKSDSSGKAESRCIVRTPGRDKIYKAMMRYTVAGDKPTLISI